MEDYEPKQMKKVSLEETQLCRERKLLENYYYWSQRAKIYYSHENNRMLQKRILKEPLEIKKFDRKVER